MKNLNTVAKAVAATVLVLTAGLASAAGSQDVTVTASVKSVCVLNFASATAVVVPFGELDPSVTGEKTQSVTVPYRCTKLAAAPTVSIPASMAMAGPSSGSIAFTMDAFSTAAGNGFSTDASATSTVRIPYNNFRDQPAGAYTGTVTLTMTP